MTVPEAEAKALADSTLLQVVEMDDKPQQTTRDFQEGRINATIDAGIVSSYTIESMNPVLAIKIYVPKTH